MLKLFDEILVSGMDQEDSREIYEAKRFTQMLSNFYKLEALHNELKIVLASSVYSDMRKAELQYNILKQLEDIAKDNRKLKRPYVAPTPIDKNIDLALVNDFKTAISEDNFNLDK